MDKKRAAGLATPKCLGTSIKHLVFDTLESGSGAAAVGHDFEPVHGHQLVLNDA